jgi:hypothetical protein
MEHKIITTENYLLVVDESEIKEGDYYLFTWGGEQDIQRFKDQESDRENHKYLYRTACKKIIAHLPINSPILEGVDLLPPLEDEVEKLADEIVGDSIYYEEDRVNLSDGMDLFMLGYNKTKEKYKYTEEDVLDAWELGASEGLPLTREKKNNLIKHLQQPKMPVAFEHENTIRPDTGDLRKEVPAQWVGEYIY